MAKFTITMKTPDFSTRVDTLSKTYAKMISKFLEYGEYATIEFDTDTETARLVSVLELE
jgi:hypothetical protein